MNTKKSMRTTYEEYKKYIEETAPILIEAEQTVDRIKHSKEWKKAYGYFQTLYNRGYLKERPTQANGYKIEDGSSIVRLTDIADLLTPEQLEQIKERL